MNPSEWRYVFSTLLYRKSALLNFRGVDFLDSTLICCHPEFISGSYYSQRSAKYYQNRFFGINPSEWRYVFSTSLYRKSALLNFRAVDFIDFTLICCHLEFVSESYYSQRSAKYCKTDSSGWIPQNDVMSFCQKSPTYEFRSRSLDSTLPKIRSLEFSGSQFSWLHFNLLSSWIYFRILLFTKKC